MLLPFTDATEKTGLSFVDVDTHLFHTSICSSERGHCIILLMLIKHLCCLYVSNFVDVDVLKADIFNEFEKLTWHS